MIATPAWPPQSTPRLFVEVPLSEGVAVRVDGGQAHYLAGVMRTKPGDPVKLFDGATGEWLAVADAVGKRDLTLIVRERLREPEPVPDLWLVAAPLKKGRIDWLAEKACELGVARLVLAETRRTVVDRVNLDRLRAHMVEAAEQCGRTAVPDLTAPTRLPALLRDWDAVRTLYFADETGGIPAHAAMRERTGPAAVLIGPEGGFTAEERDLIRALPCAVGVSLGPRILRADTAAAAAGGGVDDGGGGLAGQLSGGRSAGTAQVSTSPVRSPSPRVVVEPVETTYREVECEELSRYGLSTSSIPTRDERGM